MSATALVARLNALDPLGPVAKWCSRDGLREPVVNALGHATRVEEIAHPGVDATTPPLIALRQPEGYIERVQHVLGRRALSRDAPVQPDGGQRRAPELLVDDQLTASRVPLLTAGDEARRRVARDLHDGGQQRLVHTIIALKLAQRALRDKEGRVEALIGEALEHAEQGNAELRELAHGIHPAVLARGGLQAGVVAVVARLDLPVDVEVPAERFPAEIEASAYFIVVEALTNVVKHARATRAEVTATAADGMLCVTVRDDGTGGADPYGHGLVGMHNGRPRLAGGSRSTARSAPARC